MKQIIIVNGIGENSFELTMCYYRDWATVTRYYILITKYFIKKKLKLKYGTDCLSAIFLQEQNICTFVAN